MGWETHDGLFVSSPGVMACSCPTIENDELTEAGGRVVPISAVASFNPGA